MISEICVKRTKILREKYDIIETWKKCIVLMEPQLMIQEDGKLLGCERSRQKGA